MKQLFIISIIILFAQYGQAQEKKTAKLKKNNIQFQADRFYYTKSTDTRFFNSRGAYSGSRGLSYMRRLNTNWSVRIGYNGIWHTELSKFAQTYETSLVDSNSVGKQFSRGEWKFADLEAAYSKNWKQHHFSISAGPSFTQTRNSYVEHLSIIYIPTRVHIWLIRALAIKLSNT